MANILYMMQYGLIRLHIKYDNMMTFKRNVCKLEKFEWTIFNYLPLVEPLVDTTNS